MSVKIVLIKDIPNLGEEGDVCTVKNGYARNYLFPQRFALPYNNTTMSMIQGQASAIEHRKKEKIVAVQSIQQRLENAALRSYVRAAETGKLFGSITTANVLQAMESAGITIDRKSIYMEPHSIRQTGNYSVTLNLYGGVSVSIPLEVLAVSDEHERESIELLDAAALEAEQRAAAEKAEADAVAEQNASEESEAATASEQNTAEETEIDAASEQNTAEESEADIAEEQNTAEESEAATAQEQISDEISGQSRKSRQSKKSKESNDDEPSEAETSASETDSTDQESG